MSDRPWMPLWVMDYQGKTGHLSTIEHGAYLLLIMHYWTAGELPTDDARLARIVRMSLEEWAIIKPTIQLFFLNGWKHERIEEEIARAKSKHDRRVEAGKRGGIAKANATAMLCHSSDTDTERKEDTADAVSTTEGRYAFESGVIRLSEVHLTQWRGAFKNLDLEAELIALTEWAGTLPPGKWFFAVSGALAKRNREVGAARQKSGDFKWKSGIEGVM